MAKRREIRNSTAEFLIFQIEGKGQGIEVYYKDKTVWCTQKAMGMLFDCSTDNVGLHLKNIFTSGELVKDSVTEKISATASDGKNYMTQFYNLDAIISVGYRVNSIRATQFRQWATSVLREYATDHGDGSADPFLPEIFGGIMSVFTNNRTCNKNLIGDMAKKENNELEKRNQAFLI